MKADPFLKIDRSVNDACVFEVAPAFTVRLVRFSSSTSHPSMRDMVISLPPSFLRILTRTRERS